MTSAALTEDSHGDGVTSPLLVRCEKHAPVQAVVSPVGTKEGGQGVTENDREGDTQTDRKEEADWSGCLPARKERFVSSLDMAVGVLHFVVWWTFPPQPRTLHGIYSSLLLLSLCRSQEAI
jgi:hypothetical protein